jgi:cyclic beta-1,2-glucan synthetase
VELAPYATEHLAFVTLAAGSRASLLEMAARHATLPSLDWVLADAARMAGQEARRLRLEPA